ncbi:S8 family peptidase [Streptomyces graminofaciens]|uniref:S8 family peptidase n=1 Tax=Streptomyces graminofaciens TaxID=68212 RepID=UPI003D9AB883
MSKACAATAATTAAVVLTGGLNSPALATPEGPAVAPAAAKSGEATGTDRVTLITGDRVVMDAKGRVTGLERAEGRERIPVQMREIDGHTLVLPVDAARMVAGGRLDRRLFDVTELNEAANRRNQRDGVKVIVGYKGTARTAKADVRDAGDLRRTYKNLNLDSVQAPAEDTPELWDALTNGEKVASGISHVWLDGVRKAALDKSVPQIGAPEVWAKGYDGKGIKVAVLDTGIDTTHPDLKGQVIASKNFTQARTTGDKVGHGTHVASIVAGTGAKYKGVAPGAKILNGKVLNDEGEGDDSGIIAGMEWAAAQGADIVNLSLGGGDSPEIDPMEALVNQLSEEKGILFAIAAGNEGEGGVKTIGSPGSAAAALTVGAVDGADKLAKFSSRGPTVDGRMKPDVSAPGVAITAASAKGNLIAKEVGEKPAGYMSISGTSMATPHVAGAAALLKQAHPDWKSGELKAALMGSATAGKYAPLQGGTGRIQVDRALGRTVVAEPTSVGFPVQLWPHTDDTPVSRKLTYRNNGTKDVTLTLSAAGFDPKGKAAPAGFFTLGAKTVTVPAGGTASVDVTVNTKLGTLDGGYSASVTAAGDGQAVRSAVGVERESEAYDVTIKHVDRPGRDLKHFASLWSTDWDSANFMNDEPTTDDTVTFRVPKGTYFLDSLSAKDFDTTPGGVDWLTQPLLKIDKNTTITLDLSRTRQADITVPDADAKPLTAMLTYRYMPLRNNLTNTVVMPSFSDIRVAHVGAAMPDPYLVQTWSGQWTKGADAEYDIVGKREVKQVFAPVHHYRASELATVKAGLGASAPGRTGALDMNVAVGFDHGLHTPVQQQLPATRTLYLSTAYDASWFFTFAQFADKLDDEGHPIPEVTIDSTEFHEFSAGKIYRQTFNAGVFAPRATRGGFGVFRDTQGIYGMIPLLVDGDGQRAESDLTSATTTLYRNGKKVGSVAEPPTFGKTFKVPAGNAEYRLTTTARRSSELHAVSTRIDASWTFHSKKTTSGVPTELPTSTVRFKAPLDLDSRLAAGRTVTYPVAVEGAAKGKNLKSLTVYVSYDHGKTWKKTTVKKGKITVKSPAKDKSVSLRAKITDKKGNKSAISVYDAYVGR